MKTASPVFKPKRIFISYRHEDSRDIAERIYDHLDTEYGGDIFMDSYTLHCGLDLDDELKFYAEHCAVMLVVIGRGWLKAVDEAGRRRIDGEKDYVHVEVRAGLSRGIPVVPVLVNGAKMPVERDLPEQLSSLSHRVALKVGNHPDFKSDVRWLAEKLDEVLPRGRKKLVNSLRLSLKHVVQGVGWLTIIYLGWLVVATLTAGLPEPPSMWRK